MARIRTIKPEFWTDEKLIECSLIARLLFIGTWNFADDAGNLDRSPKQIKARIFPLDEIDCEPYLLELISHGLLTEYSVNEKKYLHISGFEKHQLINRPSKPVCPQYDLFSDSLSAHAGREGKGREGSGDSRRGTRLSIDWTMPAEWGNWALNEKPEWDNDQVLLEAAKFKDYWIAKSGAMASKLDWFATWRNWVRNTK